MGRYKLSSTEKMYKKMIRQMRSDHESEIRRLEEAHKAELSKLNVSNQWLKDQLVNAELRKRNLDYEIMKKEAIISDLRNDLRGMAKLGRSTQTAKDEDALFAEGIGREDGDSEQHAVAV